MQQDRTINIILFGKLKDIAGSSLSLKNIQDTNELIEKLHLQFPALSEVKYKIAVNKKIVNENTPLTENCELALLPPFSGG